MRKPLALLAMLCLGACSSPDRAPSQPTVNQSIDEFFNAFTDEWVRGNPNLARSSRYFTGEEQDRLERELTPETSAYQHLRIQLAKRGLEELRRFDRSQLTDSQRLSADLMEWQLDLSREKKILDAALRSHGRA
jgi:hypothetical protein